MFVFNLILINYSIIISPCEHLLARGSQQYCVFILSHIAAFNVRQGWIGIHYPCIHQCFQWRVMLLKP